MVDSFHTCELSIVHMTDVIVSQLYISECCSAAALKEHNQIPYESQRGGGGTERDTTRHTGPLCRRFSMKHTKQDQGTP